MSDDYRFLENLAYFLQQGYLIQDVLEICEFIFNTNTIFSRINMKEYKMLVILVLTLSIVLSFFSTTKKTV